MKTTIDNAGRLVIPKEVRRAAGIAAGVPLQVRWRDGRIEIEPAPADVQIQTKGKLLVAVAREKTEALTLEAVEKTRAALIDDRTDKP